MDINLKSIGHVENERAEKSDKNWGQVISKIVLNEEYKGGLKGLDDFTHAIILTYLHQANYVKEKHLQRRPRNLDTMPLIGIFSQRGKDRPNPIGVTAVKILEVSDGYLLVEGLDAIENTPILDIKPYYPQYDKVDKPCVPEWVNVLMKNYF